MPAQNIILCLNKDLHSYYCARQLLPFLSRYKLHFFISEQVGNPAKSSVPSPLQMLSFLEKIVPFEVLENAASFEKLAQENSASLAYFLPNEKDRALKTLKKIAPDLIISIRFGMIFSQEMISTTRLGILNLHSGILPNYRGVMPTFWSMHNNEKEIGCSLHWISDATIDTGDIITIHRQKLDPELCYIGNVAKLYEQGIKILIEALPEALSGRLENAKPQPKEEAYYSFPTISHLETFYKNNWKLFSSEGYRIALNQGTA